MKAFVFVGALALLAAGCGGTKTVTQTTTVTHTVTVHETTTVGTTTGASAANSCTGDAMSGTFDVIPGSAGAGQISYRLTVTNTSPVACYVSGLPQVKLVGANGSDLPTSVIPEQPGAGTAAKIVLQPNTSAAADARFSPDVNGTGDSTTGQCQPKAVTLRASFGGAPLDVPVIPATPVCERGQLRFKLFGAS